MVQEQKQVVAHVCKSESDPGLIPLIILKFINLSELMQLGTLPVY